jgi:predicted secreted protein
MIDSRTLKTQTSYSLKLHDVRKAAAAYELMHSAAVMLQMLPIPVLEALRDYVQEEVKDRKAPPTLCDRSFVEHLNELIRGVRLKEHRLFQGITGIVPHPDEDEKKSS